HTITKRDWSSDVCSYDLKNCKPRVVVKLKNIIPPSKANGFKKNKKPDCISISASIGIPIIKFAKTTPHKIGGIALPTKILQSHVLRHFIFSNCPRNSNLTPLIIKTINIKSIEIYKPLNIVAYQSGKAANIVPPDVINQTSLASQYGTIALI